MIPRLSSSTIEIKEYSSKTYSLNSNNVLIDNLAAVKQSAYLILNVQRYKHAIYSWNYGLEYEDLAGQSSSLLYSELERRITEALLQDDRIKSVTDFDFEAVKTKTQVKFTVNTIYGSYDNEVTLDV